MEIIKKEVMMKTTNIFILGLLMLVAVIGCSEQDDFDYTGGAQVYFKRVAGSGTADSVTTLLLSGIMIWKWMLSRSPLLLPVRAWIMTGR